MTDEQINLDQKDEQKPQVFLGITIFAMLEPTGVREIRRLLSQYEGEPAGGTAEPRYNTH